jgi:hypothetical protein
MAPGIKKCNIQAEQAFNSRNCPVLSPKGHHMNLITLRSFLLLLITVVIFSSCESKDEDGVPSYIHIERIGLVTVDGQGTASHKITDAWVYIDNILIGAFELPATFPVLKSGTHQVRINAGIKVNGIAATRSPYPFFKPITTSLTLTPGEISTLTDTLVYYAEQTTFEWMEDFNGGAVSIDTTSNSEARFFRVSDPQLVFKYNNETNAYSAMARVSGDTLLFECATINSFNLPKDGSPVFLEMNYRNNHNLTVGLLMTSAGEPVQQPLLVLNPSENWNKIYINLTPTISFFSGADDFRIFIGMLRSNDSETATIYFDHLKLIY